MTRAKHASLYWGILSLRAGVVSAGSKIGRGTVAELRVSEICIAGMLGPGGTAEYEDTCRLEDAKGSG